MAGPGARNAGHELKQDALRARIRGGEARATTRTGASGSLQPKRDVSILMSLLKMERLIEPTVYELDAEAVHLAQVVSGKSGAWSDPNHLKINDAETLALKGMGVERRIDAEITFAGVESPAVFKPTIDKPSQLSAHDLRSYLNAAHQRGIDVSALAVALQRKYAGPFGIIIMAIIGMPLAVSFGQEGNCDSALCGGRCGDCLLGRWRRVSATGESRVAAAVGGWLVPAADLRSSRDLFPIASSNLITKSTKRLCAFLRS